METPDPEHPVTEVRQAAFRIEGDRALLFKAVAIARAAFPTLDTNQTAHVQMKAGGSYTFDYANLAALQDATAPHLSAAGLAIMQPWWSEGNGFVVLTILTHESGAYMSAESFFQDPGGWQELGKALTYVQRYQWRAFCGISASKDDDDANSASGNSATIVPRNRPAPEKVMEARNPSPLQRDIEELAKDMGWNRGQVQAHALKLGIKKNIEELTQPEGKVLLEALTKIQIDLRRPK